MFRLPGLLLPLQPPGHLPQQRGGGHDGGGGGGGVMAGTFEGRLSGEV